MNKLKTSIAVLEAKSDMTFRELLQTVSADKNIKWSLLRKKEMASSTFNYAHWKENLVRRLVTPNRFPVGGFRPTRGRKQTAIADLIEQAVTKPDQTEEDCMRSVEATYQVPTAHVERFRSSIQTTFRMMRTGQDCVFDFEEDFILERTTFQTAADPSALCSQFARLGATMADMMEPYLCLVLGFTIPRGWVIGFLKVID